ncbi:sugar transferase [Patulibacter sp.]|uniref:sugar transferase n=1 Tax=Patulibacter sp. TaxID=1912859 RepID=UPI00271BD9D4|nr:sugar transferase [Patulibacter sp.]MDO9410775.1 sugar transferase [Patulibacter sp.]
MVLDVVVLVVAVAAAALVLGRPPAVWHVVFGFVAVGTMAARGAYARRVEDSLVVVLARHVLVSALIATMATVTGRALIENEVAPARNLVVVFIVATAALSVSRIAFTMYDRRRYAEGGATTRALVVGTGPDARRAAHRLLRRPNIGLMPIGYVDDEHRPEHVVASDEGRALPILGGVDDFDRLVAQHRIDALIVTYLTGVNAGYRLSELVARAHELRLTVFLIPRLPEVVNTRSRRHRVGTLPIDELRPVDTRSGLFRVKYFVDRVLGSLGVVALAPVLLTLALLVRASSPGPVLYRQRRVGLDGREFDILKFRSMRAEAPKPLSAAPEWTPETGMAPGGVEGEDRRTSIGKFLRSSNLDELPQLINIAKGDMCLVGPRPERPEFVERFARELHMYDARHRVKAGLTGWAQVHGLRGQTSIAERAEWDNYYIENWSFALDIAIIVRTVKTFFQTSE